MATTGPGLWDGATSRGCKDKPSARVSRHRVGDAAKEGLLHCTVGWTEELAYLTRETPYLCDRRPKFYASQGLCQSGDKKPSSYEEFYGV